MHICTLILLKLTSYVFKMYILFEQVIKYMNVDQMNTHVHVPTVGHVYVLCNNYTCKCT